MELQFQKVQEGCLQQLGWQVQQQEQTQELKLDEGMPDIGHILGAWGQPLIRGKEWDNGSVTVSGGVMVWILYVPEEGGSCRQLETWVPFQIKSSILPSEKDGTVCASVLLRNVDARSTSARKLMTRINVSVMTRAMAPETVCVYRPETLPQDVQLRKDTYLTQIPREAGEKSFSIEDSLSLPVGSPPIHKLLRYDLRPELTEQKVMADKVVFRGVCLVHALYQTPEETLHSCDLEVPFSQYGELDQIYAEKATAQILPVLTSLELEPEEGRLHLKAGLLGQYVIYDSPVLELITDAYGTASSVQPYLEQLQLPLMLDRSSQTLRAETELETDGGRVVDVAFYPAHAQENGEEAELSGRFCVLYYDADDRLCCQNSRWTEPWTWPADKSCSVKTTICSSGVPQASISGSRIAVGADMLVDAICVGQQGLPMVTGLEIQPAAGDQKERPGLILRKLGGDTLWDLAKATGTTVAAIERANGLTAPPDPERFLLIPC